MHWLVSGFGNLDAGVIDACCGGLQHYTGVEPNRHFFDSLSTAMKKLRGVKVIEIKGEREYDSAVLCYDVNTKNSGIRQRLLLMFQSQPWVAAEKNTKKNLFTTRMTLKSAVKLKVL